MCPWARCGTSSRAGPGAPRRTPATCARSSRRRTASGGGDASVNDMAGRILVGTSSWADPGFVAEWYPKGMPARERLPWYAERFDAVEVNSSFYAVPEVATVIRWAEATPGDFVFDYKLHKLLSRHSTEVESL